MDSLLNSEAEESASKLSRQVLWFVLHTLIALGAWVALMLIGYALNPSQIPQIFILGLSLVVPLVAGFAVTYVRQDDMATSVWLLGLTWLLIVALWILDMPTGPGQCLQCGASEKLTRTFFSLPGPSGLIDNDGPFLGTWPAAALAGYSIGAKLALRKRKQ